MFLGGLLLKKRIYSHGSRFFHFSDGPICKAGGGDNDRVAFPESVIICLKSPCRKSHSRAECALLLHFFSCGLQRDRLYNTEFGPIHLTLNVTGTHSLRGATSLRLTDVGATSSVAPMLVNVVSTPRAS